MPLHRQPDNEERIAAPAQPKRPRPKRPAKAPKDDRMTRPDILLGQADPATYIATTRRPDLDGDRKKFVVEGYARGLSLESLLRGSNYTVEKLFETLQLDPVAEHRTYERLNEYLKSLNLGK